jgi:hypothetical protein
VCGSENGTRVAVHAAMCGSARGVRRCNSARLCGNAVVCDSPWPCGSAYVRQLRSVGGRSAAVCGTAPASSVRQLRSVGGRSAAVCGTAPASSVRQCGSVLRSACCNVRQGNR